MALFDLKGPVVKVCGMRDPSNVGAVAALRPDLMGFIFYDRSPRCARDMSPEVVRSLPEEVTPVGLFVNASQDEILDICHRFGFATVQLHGSESPEMCRALREKGLGVIKALGVGESMDWETVRPYEGAVDMLVLDTKCDSHGGSGRKFGWHLLDSYSLSIPYLLSGGIGPEDIEAVMEARYPQMAGVDLNSRFETAPGIKDAAALDAFIGRFRDR